MEGCQAPFLFVIAAYLNSDWRAAMQVGWNFSIFPAGLIVAAFLLVRYRGNLTALSAGPFISPYVSLGSYAAPLIWIAARVQIWIVALLVLASWALRVY